MRTEAMPSASNDSARTQVRSKHLNLRLTARVLLPLVMAIAVWWVVHATEGNSPGWLHSLFVPALVLFVIGLFLHRDERHWSRPTQELLELLEQVRAGDAPIDELSKIKAGPAALVPTIQELLHELRRQKQAVAGLNDEIRQRVATRTNALEREIGSLRQQATRDVLTGLFNRRMLDSYLPQLLEKCVNPGTDLSVLMIDIDHFKLLNDTLGHKAGDDLLRDVGQIIRSGIRDNDAGFRVGGDEFVVVLPGATPASASALASRLTDLVDALAKPLRLERKPRLSVGVVSMSEINGSNVRELLSLADKRAYEVKLSRRMLLRSA